MYVLSMGKIIVMRYCCHILKIVKITFLREGKIANLEIIYITMRAPTEAERVQMYTVTILSTKKINHIGVDL